MGAHVPPGLNPGGSTPTAGGLYSTAQHSTHRTTQHSTGTHYTPGGEAVKYLLRGGTKDQDQVKEALGKEGHGVKVDQNTAGLHDGLHFVQQLQQPQRGHMRQGWGRCARVEGGACSAKVPAQQPTSSSESSSSTTASPNLAS